MKSMNRRNFLRAGGLCLSLPWILEIVAKGHRYVTTIPYKEARVPKANKNAQIDFDWPKKA